VFLGYKAVMVPMRAEAQGANAKSGHPADLTDALTSRPGFVFEPGSYSVQKDSDVEDCYNPKRKDRAPTTP